MVLTAEQKRTLRDYLPSLSNRPPGVDLGRLIDFASDTAVVLNTASSVVVAVGAEYDGKPAWAQLNELDGVIHVVACTWDGNGNLTITTSAAVTADRTVAWFVDGR